MSGTESEPDADGTVVPRDGCPNCGSYNLSYTRTPARAAEDGEVWKESCRDCRHTDRLIDT